VAEQSLYRRHRPQSFADVVGQEHVVRTLSNAIGRDRVHHAYLFVGSRGTGKTSMAKILARSLNCVDGPTLTPCGVCDSCVSIAAGSSMDVIEMDAASNRSVDDIRELRERVGYAPPEGIWKVYILDEAHMLTREAWNAFLKTLEEPPPNTVFVLATTEAHKVMPTIVDRCQRFDFGRPSPDEIAIVLRRASEAEGITLDDGAVGAIARAANGSFRDALGTLDQLVAYSGNEIATDDVLAVLGVADAELLFAATEAIAAGDGAAALRVSAEISSSGHDPGRFATDLVAHLRQLLVIATLGEIPDHFLIVAEHQARVSEQAERLGEVALLRAIDELSAAIAAIREGDEARMTVELALLRSARPEIDPSRAAMTQRIERLELALAGGSAAPAGAGQAPAPIPEPKREPVASSASEPEPVAASEREREPASEPVAASASDPAPAPIPTSAPAAAPTPEPVDDPASEERPGPVAVAAAGVPELGRVIELWPGVLDQMRQVGAGMLSAVVGVARPAELDADAGTLTIAFPPGSAFNRRKAEDKENREVVAEAIAAVVGVALRPVFTLLEATPEPAAPAADSESADVAGGVGENDLVERFISEFDAEVLIDDEPERPAQPDERIEETS
jgi:DNA polymerase-3 subunit gamma/tau